MTKKIRGRNLKDWTGKSRPGKIQKRASVELRIIGGKMRGRKFAYSGDPRTRPMMDVTREALFNLVGGWMKGKRAIDLFAGTGAIGFEALSRGAISATFIERHIPTLAILKKNAQLLEVDSQIDTFQASTFFWADELVQSKSAQIITDQSKTTAQSTKDARSSVDNSIGELISNDTPWAVFCSPPYDFFIDRQAEMLTLIESLYLAAPERSLFAIESDMRFDYKKLPFSDLWKVRQYSPAQIAILREKTTSAKPQKQSD